MSDKTRHAVPLQQQNFLYNSGRCEKCLSEPTHSLIRLMYVKSVKIRNFANILDSFTRFLWKARERIYVRLKVTSITLIWPLRVRVMSPTCRPVSKVPLQSLPPKFYSGHGTQIKFGEETLIKGGAKILSTVDELCKNGWLDLDVVWDGEWGRSRDRCSEWGRREGAVLGVNVRHPIVTNRDFVA